MRIIFTILLVLIGSLHIASADSGVSSVLWNGSSGITNCGNSSSHGVLHRGVPDINNGSVGTSGIVGCMTHALIPGDIINVLITGAITSCGSSRVGVGVVQIGVSWYVRCQSTDNVSPSVGYQLSGGTTFNNTWANSSVTSTIVCSDTGRNGSTTVGSGCSGQQYRRQSTPFICNSSGTWVNGTSYVHNPPLGVNLVEYICFRSKDNAGNIYSYSSVATIKIDRMPPVISDIINSNPVNFLANNNYTYQINISDNSGAPIVEVLTDRERSYSEAIDLAHTCNSSNCIIPWDISRVDNFRLPNGSRQYTLRVIRICDDAGNCWNGVQNYNHNVYPNTLPTNIVSSMVSEQLSNGANIARENVKNVVLRLRDIYGNAIIRASGIGRTINFHINADNNLRLDQYKNSGIDSALFAGTNTTEIPVGINQILNLNNRLSVNGDYTIPFYIFAPTSNTDPLVSGNALINSIAYSVNRTIPVVTGDNPNNQFIGGTSIGVYAKPLYTTKFTGEIIDNGFIEGADQNSNIVISRAASDTITSPSLRLEFGKVDGGNQNIPNDRFNMRVNSNNLVEGNQSNWIAITEVFNTLIPTTRTIESRVLQEPGVTPRDTRSYLASIIKYNIGGKIVAYPHAIIGKDSYYGMQNDGQTFQRGAKIIGLTSSQRTEELTTNQFINDIRVLGNLTKAELRRDIQRNVSQITRNITATLLGNHKVELGSSGWLNIGTGGGTTLAQNNILYFKNPTQTVRISGTVYGNRTLIVENGDVYIDGNIIGTGNLGIIVLKGTKGGNVYIDPSVTDIHASMFVDRSIMSFDGLNELDGNTAASTLANQLYIFGSVFSENTIGSSRSNIAVCPFYIPTASCNQVEAQKYDFNYLRRYFINTLGNPSGLQSQKSLSIPSLRDFPVIFEYNPNIQITPPPLFDIQK